MDLDPFFDESLAPVRIGDDRPLADKAEEHNPGASARHGDGFLASVLGAFPGARLVSVERGTYDPKEAANDRERVASEAARRQEFERYLERSRYEGHTPRFGDVAEDLRRQGWTSFPQERDERRQPARLSGKANGEMVKWGAFGVARPLNAVEVKELARGRNSALNAALVLGVSSGCAWALDSDVDGEMSATVAAIADEVLGATPFVRTREGSRRFARIYRYAAADPVRKATLKTLAGDVEVLGVSSTGLVPPLTSHGLHWRDARRFDWATDPRNAPPTAAPVVTAAQVARFLERVEETLGAVRRPTVERVVTPASFDGTLVVPGGAGSVPGVTYGADGLAVDGREKWLLDRTRQWCMCNPGAPFDTIVARVVEEAERHLFRDGRWHDVRREVEDKVRQTQRRIASGDLRVRRTYSGEEGTVYVAQDVEPVAGDDRDVLALCGTKRRNVKLVASTAPDTSVAALLAFQSDEKRREETARVAREVRESIASYLDALWDVRDAKASGFGVEEAEAALAAVRLVVAPTGAGKTTTFMSLIARQVARRGKLGGPIAFLMPSYTNIEETKGKLMGAADEERLAVAMNEASAVGLAVSVYEGKVKGGCRVAGTQTALMEAKVPTAGLCEADVDLPRRPDEDGPNTERRVCEHAERNDCPVINKRREAPRADVLFMPTCFLSIPMKKHLRDAVRGVAVDERCWPQLVETKSFPATALEMQRARGYATKAEREATGIKDSKRAAEAAVNALHEDRALGARVALAALRRGEDPAAALHAHSEGVGERRVTVTGRQMAENAKRVCGRAGDKRRSVHPGMTDEQVRKLVSEPTQPWVWEERAFWARIVERLDDLDAGVAKGARDYRVQMLDAELPPVADYGKGGPTIRVSSRVASPFAGHPTMLLDASADERIVAKLWNGRRVGTTRIDAGLHMRVLWAPDRTWADSSYVPSKAGDDEGNVATACGNMVKLRRIMAAVCGLHGNGRVIAGLTKSGRYAFHDGHAELPNLDTLHFGAVAGLDFAKGHLAAVCVGRMELPVRAIDAIVAALTYDDDVPEDPVDRGDGNGADGKPARAAMAPRTHRRRDGSTATILVPEYAGAWARIVQRQRREEEIRQFVGRLRPVYREGTPPLVVLIGSVIPEDLVVDAVVHSDDLATYAAGWEGVRRSGIADPRLAAAVAFDVEGVHDDLTRIARDVRQEGMQARVAQGLVKREWPGIKPLLLPAWAGTEGARVAWQEAFPKWPMPEEDVLLERGAEPAASAPRPRDEAFEAVHGTREDRVAKETSEFVAARIWLVETQKPEDVRRPLVAGQRMDLSTLVEFRRARHFAGRLTARGSGGGTLGNGPETGTTIPHADGLAKPNDPPRSPALCSACGRSG